MRSSVLPGMIDQSALTAFGNVDTGFGLTNTAADVFPYSVDVTNLAAYNQYLNAANRNYVVSSTGNPPVSRSSNQATTSLTGYNTATNTGNTPGVTSLTGYNQASNIANQVNANSYSGYNQLSNAGNSFNYGAGTGIGTGSGSATVQHNVNPYIYTLNKRHSEEVPMDLMAEDSKRSNQLPKPPTKGQSQPMDNVGVIIYFPKF